MQAPLINQSRDTSWRALQEATGTGDLSQNWRFELPDLRVGSLDALLTLSDDLMRVNAVVEGVVHKLRRQATEVIGEDSDVLTINQRPVGSFLTSFAWDEAKFPSRKPLKDVAEDMANLVQGIDDDLKARSRVVGSKGRQGSEIVGLRALADARTCTVARDSAGS